MTVEAEAIDIDPDPEIGVRIIGVGDGPDDLHKALGQIQRDGDAPSADAGEDDENLFTENGAIEPPNDPAFLCRMFEASAALRPNIQATVNNVDGFGHRFEPVLSEDPKIRERAIEDALFAAKLHEAQLDDEDEITEALLPSAEEVAAKGKRIGLLARVEAITLRNFFGSCCGRIGFRRLRRQTRQDLEIFGYAFWEVTRNKRGKAARLTRVPSISVRLLPKDKEWVEAETVVPISAIEHRTEMEPFQFRRFIQIASGRVVFFKEYGDPRVTSRKTGKRYVPTTGPGGEEIPAVAVMKKEEGANAKEAHELIHFQIDSPRSPYGMPRWIGALPNVIGGREAEEVNLLYFNNKSVPPLAIIVSGGKLTDGAIKSIKDHIETQVKGKKNFHRVMILEGETGATKGKREGSAGRIKIEIKPLTQAQLSDAQFLKYTERSQETVGAQFLLPPILRGQMRDFNRSTADAAIRYAEVQVFEPMRQEFDHFMGRFLLHEFAIRFWVFVTNAPVNRDPEVMSENVRKLMNAGALVPKDGRALAADIFNVRFPVITEDWVDQPLQLTIATAANSTPE